MTNEELALQFDRKAGLEPYQGPIEPGVFYNAGESVGKGLYRGALQTEKSLTLIGANLPISIDRFVGGTDLQDAYFGLLVEPIDKSIDKWTPNALDTGKAAQMLGSFAEIAAPLALGGGAGQAALLANTTLGTASDLATKQGVDAETAVNAGVVGGAALAGGIAAPFFGNTFGRRIISGVTANVAQGAIASGVQSNILSENYPQAAEQFSPTDPWARGADALAGGIFGGMSHFSQLPHDVQDAAMTVRDAEHFANDTAPGVPADLASSAKHQQALAETLDALHKGEVPEVSKTIEGAAFHPRPVDLVSQGELILAQHGASETRAELPYNHAALDDIARSVEQEMGLPSGLLLAIKNHGEKSNSSQVSKAGAKGVMQFMPENLAKYGVTDPTDPVQSIIAAGRYLQDTLKQYNGNIDAVIADYNGGPRQAKAVLRGEYPPAAETAAYLRRVKAGLGDMDSSISVQDKISNRLQDTGIYTKSDADLSAVPMAKYIETRAKAFGMSPDEFYGRYGADIVGGDGGAGYDQILPEALPKNMVQGDGQKAAAMYRGEDKTQAVLLGQAGERLASDAPALSAFSHSASTAALSHIRNKHGDPGAELKRGQVAITDKDIAEIPNIVGDYEHARFDLISKSGLPAVAYVKRVEDGVILYVEEVRKKRKDLAALSMRKYPATADAQNVLQHAADGLNVQNGGGHVRSIDETFDSYKQNQSKGFYDPERNFIGLLQSADKSTFLHESGHYFLELDSRLASLTDAPQSLKADFNRTLKWLGVDSAEQWRSMSRDEKSPYHEQFAKGFEQYLREGKAPTPELKSVFKRFKEWLQNIYQSAQELGVELSPEIRGVFARMMGHEQDNYHPAIKAYADELVEGGGVSYLTDEHGTITGRTQSVNPPWFKDKAFEVNGRTPSVMDIKQAVDDYQAGRILTNRQQSILRTLSDLASYEEQLSNEHFNAQQEDLARELNALVVRGKEAGPEIEKLLRDVVSRDELSDEDLQTWRDDIENLIQDRGARSDNVASETLQQGAEQTGNIRENAGNADPEYNAARQSLDEFPDMTIQLDDGADILARDALAQADADYQAAENDSLGFMAAITCFLRG